MNKQIFIESERLWLRQWEPSDEALYVAMNQDPKVMQYFPSTLSSERSLDHIKKIKQEIIELGYGLFALERKADHQFIGYTGFAHPEFDSFFTPCIEIGWRLAEAYWHQGYATEAARVCIHKGFTDFGFQEICSFTAATNLPSEKVMLRCGMDKVGYFDHPKLEMDHPLQKHVLYKISKPINA